MLLRPALLLGLIYSNQAFSHAYVQGEERFELTYQYAMPSLQPGEKVAVWLPLASSDAFQTVTRTVSAPDLATKEIADPDFHNDILYTSADASQSGKSITVTYTVKRREHGDHAAGTESAQALYLRSEPLVPLNARFKKLALEITRGKATDLDKARAIYDYVFKEMKYDKSGSGWGRGDAVYACDAKTGNCTDFHALFSALARSVQIPTRFAIGFTIPAEGQAGPITGYHCWAEFAADGRWVPVDISEAAKEPTSKDYYFGHHPANRFQVSMGRDLHPVPAPRAGGINFLVHPYVEIDGKAVKGTTGTYTFKRLAEPAAKS